MTSFTINQSLEERRTAMDQVLKATVAIKLEKEMSALPSTPALTRGPSKTQERQMTPGNPRKNSAGVPVHFLACLSIKKRKFHWLLPTFTICD